MNTKSLTFTVGLLTVGYIFLALPACSSDEDEDGNAAGTGGSSGSGATGGSGTGGSSSGGTGGSATGGTGGTSSTITCGTQTCQGPTGIPLQPCCAGTAQDKCGINIPTGGLGCQEQNQPGNPDQSCTDAFNQAAADAGFGAGGAAGATGAAGASGGFQLEGCCRPDGTCGIVFDFGGLNLGCVDVSQFGDGGVTVPTCTP